MPETRPPGRGLPSSGGGDPAGEKRGHREALTFAALAAEYIERHAKPRKRSWRGDEGMLRRHVPRALPRSSSATGS